MKNITTKAFFFIATIVLFISCEKQDFKGDPGVPVFMAEIPFLNDNNFEVVAGDDLYYMFASHQELDNSIIYSGLFGKEDICEEACEENFAIKFANKENAQESIVEGEYEYYSVPKDGFKHNFELVSTDPEALNWTIWSVGDEDHEGQLGISFDSNNDSAPQDEIQMLYDVPGQFIVEFERPVLPKSVECALSMNVTRKVNEGIFLELSTESPFTYVSWSNGAVGKKIKVDFQNQVITANVFDGSGCQTKVIVYFKTKNIEKDYSLTMKQDSYMFSSPDNADRAVIIEYTDKQGDFYTTSVLGQILPFNFVVNKVENYRNNELNEETWKIDSSFDCILFGENGKTKRIKDGKAVFAVSH
jgi:hypothetical protein